MFEVTRRRPAQGSAPPCLEPLEDRAVPAVIGGVVYYDHDMNGLPAYGDSSIAGSQLRLLDSSGQVIATATSDANGRYEFTKRDAALISPTTVSYESAFVPARTDVSQTATVSQFDPTLGTLTAVEILAEGAVQSQVQLENLEKGAATLRAGLNATIQYQAPGAGTIEAKPATTLEANLGGFDGQADLSGTSAKDFGVTRLDGQFTSVTVSNPADLAAYIGTGQVSLTQTASVTSSTSGPGNLLAMMRSTASGKVKVVYHYTPSDELGPGKYTVVQTQPGGFLDWKETSDGQTPIPGSERTDAIEVTVASRSDQLLNNHFGEATPGSVSGTVYLDADRSGAANAGDGGLAGVLLQLSGTDVYGQAVMRTTQTDASGNYRFADLVPGTYLLSETQPAGYQQGTNTVGNIGGVYDGDQIRLGIPSGVHAMHYNFGEVRPAATRAPIVTPNPVQTDPSYYASKFFFSPKTLLELGW